MPSIRVTIVRLAILIAAGIMPLVAAHPGESHNEVATQLSERNLWLRDQSHLRKRCASHFKKRGIEDRSSERRKALVNKLRAEKGLPLDAPYLKRDLATALAIDHNETTADPDVTLDTSQDSVFGDNTSCLLWPDITEAEGPYYVRDDVIRQNGREDLGGVNITIDLQIIDINTCEPVANQYTEFWSANATGVYSGTDNSGNGNESPALLNTTFQRAIWPTDDEGVVQVDLLFPGWYAVRAPHTHFIVHENATLLPNDTLVWDESTIHHVGQIFYDQSLVDDVVVTYPYTLNTNVLTLNSEDYGLAEEAADEADPIAYYVYLGESVTDGLVLWVTLGMNSSSSWDINYAATWTADGGVENPDANGAGGSGGGGFGSGGLGGLGGLGGIL